MQTAVVILNWNGKDFLRDFLPGVIAHTQDEARIIVADNASTDDSVAYLKEFFPQVEVILNDKNYGFAGGYNEVLKRVDAEYYVLLNSDIEVTEGWLTPMVKMMNGDMSIGAVQPKLKSFYEKDKFEYAGAAGGFIDIFAYPFCRGRLFQHIEHDNGQYDQSTEIFWATGACMMVRADLWHKLGGLDVDFFAHMEEIDFCWRLKLEGYKVMYSHQSHVYHVGGGTLPKKSWKKTYLNMRNNNIMLWKNLPIGLLIPVSVMRLFLDGIAALKFLIDGGWHDLWAVFRAHSSFYRTLGRTVAKRRGRKITLVPDIYLGNIVWEHFIRGKKQFDQLSEAKFRK